MITVIGGIKGGSGKTTVATNLCVMRSQQGKKVLLVDADEQKTASNWATHREALGIETKWTTIQLEGKAINIQLRKMASDYDDIIIDVGGRNTTSQRAALAISNLAVIPFKPKSFDMWTLGLAKGMINEMRAVNPDLGVYAVINQADARGSDNDEAIEMIKEVQEFVCLECVLGNRKAFANAAAEGLGVVELKKTDVKAEEEIKTLYESIYFA